MPEFRPGTSEATILKQEIQALKQTIKDLQQQLQQERQKPTHRQTVAVGHIDTTTDDNEGYETDEAEFDPAARGAEWMAARPTKKRKASSSPRISPAKPAVPDKPAAKTPPKPPPIFVQGKGLHEITTFLKTNNLKATTKAMRLANNFKINPVNEEEYKKTSQWLNDTKAEWHTFENKHTRPLRVMARGLHKDTNPDDIAADLVAQGFKIANNQAAVNIKNSRTKQALNLFMLSFQHEQDPKAVFGIRFIERQIVKIEEIRNKRRNIAQCKKCQDFNHTQAFCHRKPACVKCGGAHLTQTCTKSKDEPAKCVNCNGAHPASYRGCTYAANLQQARKKPTTTPHNQPKQVPQTSSQLRQPNLSYAQQLTKNNPPRTQADPNMCMSVLLAFIEEQKTFNKMVSERLAPLQQYRIL